MPESTGSISVGYGHANVAGRTFELGAIRHAMRGGTVEVMHAQTPRGFRYARQGSFSSMILQAKRLKVDLQPIDKHTVRSQLLWSCH